MIKKTFVLILGLVFVTCFSAADEAAEKADVIKVIDDAYLNGVCNVGDVEAVKKGFHEDFSLKGINNGKLSVLPISRWIEIIGKRKAEGHYPPKEKTRFEYPLIDITGNTAMVKIHYIRGDKHIYTDYLLILRFSEGWRITDKIYFSH
jgi:hypothetical protein